VQLGQLLLIQIGLFVNPGFITELKQRQKKEKGNKELISAQRAFVLNSLSFWPRSTKWGLQIEETSFIWFATQAFYSAPQKARHVKEV